MINISNISKKIDSLQNAIIKFGIFIILINNIV